MPFLHDADPPSELPKRQSKARKRLIAFKEHLKCIQDTLMFELATYQSHATSLDEFARIFECLDSVEEIWHYFARSTGTVAVFFPLNMPMYALLLYGIFPALMADNVFIRAPQKMTGLIKQVLPALNLSSHFPNIHMVFDDRQIFVDQVVAKADVTIFTGRLVNAQLVMSKTKKDSLFLFNGWGCNPIVVGQDADIALAARKAVEARLFSSGCDCAGPDTILIPRMHSEAFVEHVRTRLENVKVGPFTDPDVTVGPLVDSEQIKLISTLFLKVARNILFGGQIDYKSSTILPTLVVLPLFERTNFEELFAPVLFVNVYDQDEDLRQYFEDPLYVANEMYISLFGRSQYVESLSKSIIVQDQCVFDIDRGNEEFGGYSVGASFVASSRRITPKPVLVPREMFEWLESGASVDELGSGRQQKLGKQFYKKATRQFGSNLVFGFVFGSVAEGRATKRSDINTMIVVNHKDEAQIVEFERWLRATHLQNGMFFKDGVSAILLTAEELEKLLKKAAEISRDASLQFSSELSIVIEALSGRQRGVAGNQAQGVQYSRQAMQYSKMIQTRLSTQGRGFNSASPILVQVETVQAEHRTVRDEVAQSMDGPLTDRKDVAKVEKIQSMMDHDSIFATRYELDNVEKPTTQQRRHSLKILATWFTRGRFRRRCSNHFKFGA